jgi:hypothetical protein
MPPETKTRNSRWDDNLPVIRRGKTVAVTPTEREEQTIFPILDRAAGRIPWSYDMLPLDYIHALAGEWNRDYLGDRLPLMCRPPNRHLRRPESQTANLKANSRFQVYAHADTALTEDEFWHDLLANMVIAQIEIGAAKEPDFQLANFARLLAGPQLPADGSHSATIKIRRPDIETKSGKKIKSKPHRVTADWQPFGIGEGRSFRFYFGIEADKSTEPLRTQSHARKSISSMFKRYLEIDELKLTKQLYGLPNFYYPFVTSNPSRVPSMIELLMELTEGKGHPRFIFSHFPTYNSFRTPPLPDGALFRSAWKRAGYPDHYMNQL